VLQPLFVVCLNLNPKDKNKRKRNWEIHNKRKGKRSPATLPPRPFGPLSPAKPPVCASVSADRRAPPVGATPRLLACSLPLCPVGLPHQRPGPLRAHAPMSLFREPRLTVPLPSFNRPPMWTARTHAETAALTSPPSAKPTSQPPPQVPACTHFPPASFTLHLRTHLSCVHPFFKLAGAPLSPGLLHPNPPPAELARRP
jgi:hypothetical protein